MTPENIFFPKRVDLSISYSAPPLTSNTNFSLSNGQSPVGSRICWGVMQCLLFISLSRKVPSSGPVTKAENIGVKTVTIAWKEIPKSQRNGFISNYTIFYEAEDGKKFCKCAL